MLEKHPRQHAWNEATHDFFEVVAEYIMRNPILDKHSEPSEYKIEGGDVAYYFTKNGFMIYTLHSEGRDVVLKRYY